MIKASNNKSSNDISLPTLNVTDIIYSLLETRHTY